MNIPAINPQLNNNINDHSKVDESIKQEGLTIHAGAGSVINSNSGNGNGKPSKWGMSALFQVLAVSIICDILICGFITMTTSIINDKAEERAVRRHEEVQGQIAQISADTTRAINEMKDNVTQVTANSKEGTIWILRRDILNSIDYHESQGTITAKQYKRIKDQFDYYKSIGGNHDVEGKFDDFTSKIYGTAEIKMTK